MLLFFHILSMMGIIHSKSKLDQVCQL